MRKLTSGTCRETMMENPQAAGVTQLVECNLAKVDVAGSNPVSRSIRLPPQKFSPLLQHLRQTCVARRGAHIDRARPMRVRPGLLLGRPVREGSPGNRNRDSAPNSCAQKDAPEPDQRPGRHRHGASGRRTYVYLNHFRACRPAPIDDCDGDRRAVPGPIPRKGKRTRSHAPAFPDVHR